MKEKRDSKDPEVLLIDGAGSAVQLVSFLTAISFFFAGLLLTGDKVEDQTRSLSLSLLFASAFGFLFSALFYSNLIGKKRLGALDAKQASRGNILSEYFGVYGLVFATPLAIYSYSGDVLMSSVVFLFVASGITIYQIPKEKTSILERYFSNKVSVIITITLIAFALGQLLASFFTIGWLLYTMTAGLWLVVIFLAVFSWNRVEKY